MKIINIERFRLPQCRRNQTNQCVLRGLTIELLSKLRRATELRPATIASAPSNRDGASDRRNPLTYAQRPAWRLGALFDLMGKHLEIPL